MNNEESYIISKQKSNSYETPSIAIGDLDYAVPGNGEIEGYIYFESTKSESSKLCKYGSNKETFTGKNLENFLRDLLGNAGNKGFVLGLDELGRIIFKPNQDTRSLQPVWTYTDDNSSILYPDLDISHDLYGIPNVVEVVYSASKSAIIGFTKALSKEVGPSGITVNAVAPGVIETDMLSSYSQNDLDALAQETSLQRLGKPDDVSGVVSFFLSEKSDFVTGQVLTVDGGLI